MVFEKPVLANYTNADDYLTAKIALISGMSFLGISYGLIFLLWFFMVSDTILGVAKVVALESFTGLTKAKFLAGILTKISILFIPLSIALTGALVGFDLSIFVFTSIYVLIANDAASCYTNLLSIKKRKRYENKDLVVWLINALRYLIYKTARNAIDKLNKPEK